MRTPTRLAALVATGVAAASAAAAPPPAVDAPAWVVESGTGQIVGGVRVYARRPIASITKLMTVLCVLDHHRLSDVVTVDPRAAAVGQSSIGLQAGEQLTVRDLIRGALIQSANDAAVALALATSPDLPAFAKLMNVKAKALGLVHTHFVRPDGLDAPGEYSSAADVTLLAREAMKVEVIRTTVDDATASIAGGRVLHTWNDLLGRVPGIIGVKTGHTGAAGWSQVAAQRRTGILVYATILGSPTREQRNADLERLLVWGMSQFKVVDAVEPGRPYASVALPYGRRALALVANERLRAVVPPGRVLTQRVIAARSAKLPVFQGEVLGRVEVWLGSRLVGRRRLVAARSVAAPGVAGRVGWYATRTVHDIAGLFT
jgi:serine-type D-Ala-D-Ala carboxypeptidase (penicillin-binding protein 5/6)